MSLDIHARIVIVGKRQKKKQERLCKENWLVIDVTSSSDDHVFKKLAPSFPHGGILVPGAPNIVSESIEGVWQGLKVFENEGVDSSKYKIKTMKNIKRIKSEKRGKVIGHAFNGMLLDYVTSRKEIYIPTYNWVLEHKLHQEVCLLADLLLEQNRIAFVDNDTNENVDCTKTSLSHASLLKKKLLDILST